MLTHTCEGCGREHTPCCSECSCVNAQDDTVESLLDTVDIVATLANAMDGALYQHRGAIMADRRYHCLCGWVSEQANAHDLARADVRVHLVAQQLLAVHEVSSNG